MTNKRILTLISLLLVSFLLVGCWIFPNHPPEITTTALPNATVDDAYTATVKATDPDGDPLTYSLYLLQPILTSSLVMTIDSTSGEISGWTPITTDSGEVVTVEVRVNDGDLEDTQEFEITVVGAP